GSGERHASANHPGVRDERQSAPTGARCAPAAVLANQAGLQAHQVPGLDDVHRSATRRLLGGPGVSLVRRDLETEATASPSPSANAIASVRRRPANAASSRSRDRNTTNPPNASPPAER